METGTALADLVARDWPDIDRAALFSPAAQMGEAPEHARRFAKAANGV
jgi:3-carboxy-cis,cis-muconate cycloisomerase